MAAYRTRQDYDYDYDFSSYSSSERDLAVHDLVLAESGRNIATESALALRPSERLVHRGSGTYDRHDARAVRYVPMRRETDMVTLSEAVRSNWRQIDRTNRKIQPGSMYSQIHPKMREDGSYPRDFNMALTLDQFEALDMNTLDRILISYGLLCTFTGRSRDIKRQKLWRLFQYLGADALAPGGGPGYSSPTSSVHATDGGSRYVAW